MLLARSRCLASHCRECPFCSNPKSAALASELLIRQEAAVRRQRSSSSGAGVSGTGAETLARRAKLQYPHYLATRVRRTMMKKTL